MEKVKLPKEVAEAIELVWSRYNPNGFTRHMVLTNWSLLSEKHPHQWAELRDYAHSYPVQYMQALVNGYEVEKSPEDKVRERIAHWKTTQSSNGGNAFEWLIEGAVTILNDLNIKIDGVNT